MYVILVILLNNLGINMSSQSHNFKEQFSKLEQKEKVDFAKNLLEKVDEATDFLTLSMNTWFRRMTKSRTNDDLRGFEGAEFKLINVQKEDSAFSKLKIEHLSSFKEIKIDDINVLTPEMEDGINGFVNEYCAKKFKLNDVSSLHIEKALFLYSKKISKNSSLKTNQIQEKSDNHETGRNKKSMKR